MAAWRVFKFVTDGGRCPLDEWLLSNAVTDEDAAVLFARLEVIEGVEGRLPPEWIKKYKGSSVYELKVRAPNKQLRPFCVYIDGKRIVILCGAIEKGGKIPAGNVQHAENLLQKFKDGKGEIRPYDET